MSEMSPRIVLSVVDENGRAPLPQSVGGVPIWSRAVPWPSTGGLDAVIYTDDALTQVVVIQRVASCTLPNGAPGALSIAWVPAPARDGDNPLFDQLAPALAQAGLLIAGWPVDADMGVTALEVDTSPAALAALAAWPATWRSRLPSDDAGSTPDTAPSLLPTGRRIVAQTVA